MAQSQVNKFSKFPVLFDSKTHMLSTSQGGLATELDAEIKGLKKELSYYQNAMYELGQKKIKKDSKPAHCQDGFGIAKCQVSFMSSHISYVLLPLYCNFR